jgi:tyrosyl-tRNA synthetase
MTEKRQEIIKRLLSKTAEVITPEEFEQRLNSGEQLTHYIGFEISGYVHIGQGIMSALVMKDLIDLGVHCTVWLADWHTAINNKLDGTAKTAAKIGTGYFTEAMKACLVSVGADPSKVEFRLASEWYAKDDTYLGMLLNVAKHTTVARAMRSISIMGKEEGAEGELATLFYPAMQAADIFFQSIDIAHSAMDQRKAHVIMRDVAAQVAPGKPKPVALHHALIDSLTGDSKMSKSKPDSAVFIHDSVEDIQRKIKKAFCEEKNITKNPILNWTKHILFWNRSHSFVIDRKPEHGGSVEFAVYEQLEKSFADGEIHPMDLKNTVAQEIVALLEPVRAHFEQSDVAAKKAELDKVLANR